MATQKLTVNQQLALAKLEKWGCKCGNYKGCPSNPSERRAMYALLAKGLITSEPSIFGPHPVFVALRRSADAVQWVNNNGTYVLVPYQVQEA